MNLSTETFDLWVFARTAEGTRYLLFHNSHEKANRWFGGARFWQAPPSGGLRESESLPDAIRRIIRELELDLRGAWAAEFTYTIWNRRRERLEMLPVFAAEVAEARDVPMTWEIAEQAWLSTEQCYERLFFRGPQEGLANAHQYVGSVDEPSPLLRVL